MPEFRDIAGVTLIALPFAAVLLVVIRALGFLEFLSILAVVALVGLCLSTGFWLLG